MSVQPFRFKLKKVSAAEQRVLSALFDFLPKTGMRDKFGSSVREALSKHLGVEADYFLESVVQGDFSGFLEKMPDPAVLVVLGMAPREGKVVLEIDDHLAALLIEKLLGGTAETPPAPKPLSDTEQGVLQYLILQVLAHIYRICGNDARLHFRFERFVFTPKGLKGQVPDDEAVSAFTVKMTVGKHSGFVRLYMPSPLVEQQYLNVPMKGETRDGERAFILERLGEFAHLTVPLWADAGFTTVSATELNNLEEGDVVLFDSTELMLTNTGPAGRVVLRTGEGRHGGFVSEVTVVPKKIHCKIVGVKKGEDIA